MKGILSLIGMSIGGWLGWVLGGQISFFTGFIVSVIGSGAGLYFTQRAMRDLLP